MTQFQLTPYNDLYLVTILLEGPIRDPFFLCHKAEGGLGWSNDRIDGKPFQYKLDAIEYAITNTNLKRWREPRGKGWIEVRFDTKQVVLTEDGKDFTYLTFAQARAIHGLPIYKGPKT